MAKRVLRENGLGLFFAGLFAFTVAAQSFVGQHATSAERREHGESPISWLEYVRSVDFWGAVMENWQSEFLQFTVFIGATIWLVQKGSVESKRPDELGSRSEEEELVGAHARADSPRFARGTGLPRRLYENSLLLAMGTIFVLSWVGQSLNNWRSFNDEQRAHDEAGISWVRYLLEPEFWEKTLQNWQSEFLAVGVMVVFTIYLRQRGSPESKKVGASHNQTGSG